MKLGLLGSTETHRGTRWTPNWAFAVREAWVGEFEFSEIHHGRGELEGANHPLARLVAAVEEIPGDLEAFQLCSSDNKALEKHLEVVLAPFCTPNTSILTCKPFRPHASPSPLNPRNFDVVNLLFDDVTH
ncbi:hypothetical protein E3N88_18468 [Mikania micrantha]|uniref:Uncharacterized protein n=1 Tax=Mikania micrantha TaxID=192012 RepID=A0A5N6NKK6_9ASTR|nr:hypothetical protein E3N88_18468 [Mikania micrantha]